jgi:sarcosine reductase
MKLELSVLKITDIKFAQKTDIRDGVLFLNGEELKELLKDDWRLRNVEVEIVLPGEKCRIIRVIDVIEPRSKVGNSRPNFPGAIDDQGVVGDGGTCVLRGVGVVVTEFADMVDLDEFRKAVDIVDMWGPAGDLTPYSKLNNIVVMADPAHGVSIEEYRVALKIAGLKAAVYLAKAAEGFPPDEVVLFELSLDRDMGKQLPDLPGVAYIFQILSTQFDPLDGDPVLYGENVERIVPTILHPNEIFDGAVTVPYGSIFMETYFIQNHPILEQLYRNHGKNLRLQGVIMMNAPNNVDECERAANMAANLAKHVLHADAAILTKAGGGAPEWVMMRTAQRCEQIGIRTALAFLHMGIDITEPTPKPTSLFYAPEVDAMVSMGAPVGSLRLFRAERLIGRFQAIEAVKEGAEWPIRRIKGSLSQLGNSRLRALRY